MMGIRMEVVLDTNHGWTTQRQADRTVHWAGAEQSIRCIVDSIQGPGVPDPETMGRVILAQFGCFSGIVEGPNWALAFVDRLRAYPVYYTREVSRSVISNSGRLARVTSGIHELDHEGMLEFCLAGYATGRDTVFQNLHKLRAGELLLWDGRSSSLATHRYYRYLPSSGGTADAADWTERLGQALDTVFERVARQSAGLPIWVSLSGGWDSRLVLCKLHEMGCGPLHAFTYGPRASPEAIMARKVADRLRVPWVLASHDAARARRLFRSATRRAYWDLADGCCSIPPMSQFEPFHALRSSGQIPEGALIITGHSGDFTTGNHIPPCLIRPGASVGDLVRYAFEKHFSLWRGHPTDAEAAILRRRILADLDCSDADGPPSDQIASLFESWEWSNRQTTYVIPVHRLYESLGCSWRLPLWEPEFARFWEVVPLPLRVEQELYVRYLQSYDYLGLFRGMRLRAQMWSGLTHHVVRLSRGAARRLFGPAAEDWIHRYAVYFGQHGYCYAQFGLARFLRMIGRAMVPPSARGISALSVAAWLEEQGLIEHLPAS